MHAVARDMECDVGHSLNAEESGTECTGWGCSARGVIDIAETDLRISRDQKSETEFDHHLSVSA